MKYFISSEFETLIGGKRLDDLNSHPNSVYGLDSNLNISYLNPGWFEFAEDNGSNVFVSDEWSLGTNIFDCIPNVLESFYRDLYETTLSEKGATVVPRQSEYECSSPELYRNFSMHLYPMGKDGIVVVNSLIVEEPHKSRSVDGLIEFEKKDYLDENGILHQCANCRRTQNLNTPERWDWIPIFIEKPYPKTSHGICSVCMQHYYLK